MMMMDIYCEDGSPCTKNCIVPCKGNAMTNDVVDEFEKYMSLWDSWRKYIANGGKASWPRDAFEAVVDDLIQTRQALKAREEELEKVIGLLRIAINIINDEDDLFVKTSLKFFKQITGEKT